MPITSRAGFTDKTFKYFDQAKKNKTKLVWFESNKDIYQTAVREPFARAIEQISKALASDLPRFEMSPKSITRPVRPKNRVTPENSPIKTCIYATLGERRSSLFEWNPSIHFQIGNLADDNLVGVGLYMISSRQTSLLRNALFDDFEEIDSILSNKKFIKTWGGIQGDKYVRFPKGYNSEDPRCKYHWHKQFYISKNWSRAEVKSKDFTKKLVKDLEVAAPFLQWVRNVVGVYKKARE
jgi:uncharacterized protein (TIGR02453 family)